MDELRIMDRPALTIVGKRTEARLSSIGAVIGRSFGEAFGALGSHAGGAPFVIYETAPEGDRPFAIEVCVPLASPAEVVPPEGWEVRVLPAPCVALPALLQERTPAGPAPGQRWLYRQGFGPTKALSLPA